MKARIKETGEIVECALAYDGTITYISHGKIFGIVPENVEVINDDIDWEKRRFELVKAAMQGLLSTELFCGHEDDEIARMAISQADAVLAEYRKGGEE